MTLFPTTRPLQIQQQPGLCSLVEMQCAGTSTRLSLLMPTSTLSPYYQCLQMQPPARQWYLAAMYKPCRGNNLTPAPSRCKEVQKIRQLIWRLPNFYQRQISFITGLHPGPGQPGTSTGNTQNARILQQEMYYLPAQNKHATKTEWREMMLSPILRRGSPRLIQQRRSSSPFNTINKVKFWLWRHLVGRPQVSRKWSHWLDFLHTQRYMVCCEWSWMRGFI